MRCPFCKEEIQDGAIKCKHCKSFLVPIDSADSREHPYLAVASMVVGIMVILGTVGATGWDRDTAVGAIFVGLVGIGLGVGSRCMTSSNAGRKAMAVVGVVLSSIALLISLRGL